MAVLWCTGLSTHWCAVHVIFTYARPGSDTTIQREVSTHVGLACILCRAILGEDRTMVAIAPPQRTLDQVVSFSQQDFEAVNRNLSVNNSGWMDRACPKEMRVRITLLCACSTATGRELVHMIISSILY